MKTRFRHNLFVVNDGDRTCGNMGSFPEARFRFSASSAATGSPHAGHGAMGARMDMATRMGND